jgi:hypothetical protein
MQITITEPVTYAVDKVEIQPIYIGLDDDKLRFHLSYRWLDVNSTELKNGQNQYTQDQMEAMFQAQGQSFTPFKNVCLSFFPVDGIQKSVSLDYNGVNLIVKAGSAKLDPEDNRMKHRMMDVSSEVVAADLLAAGITAEQVWQVIQLMVQTVLAA